MDEEDSKARPAQVSYDGVRRPAPRAGARGCTSRPPLRSRGVAKGAADPPLTLSPLLTSACLRPAPRRSYRTWALLEARSESASGPACGCIVLRSCSSGRSAAGVTGGGDDG